MENHGNSSWDKKTAHQRFWDNLVNGALDRLLECPEELKSLRFDYEELRRRQKTLGLALDQRGTSMMRLVAEAHGEHWDSEDEEKFESGAKKCPNEVKAPIREQHAVEVGTACQICVREGEIQGHELQASDDRREEFLQKVR